MKWKNFLPAIAIVLFAACNNETSDTTTTTDSSSVTGTTSGDANTSVVTVDVPEATRTSFQTKYPKASNVRWSRYQTDYPITWEWTGWPSMDTSDYVASFNMDGTDYWVWYDESGNWVGEINPVTSNSLPAAVNNTIQSQFPGFTIVSATKENDKDRVAYEIKMEKGADKVNALIAENGKVLKKKANIGGEKTKEKAVKDEKVDTAKKQ